MCPHEIVSNEIADTVIQLGRTFEVGEQESEAGDLQPLVDIECVRPIDVTERLISE